MAITYEILALRYAILDGGRLQYQNYIIPDDHLAPDPLDFLIFASLLRQYFISSRKLLAITVFFRLFTVSSVLSSSLLVSIFFENFSMLSHMRS